jgi:hypothetical protein
VSVLHPPRHLSEVGTTPLDRPLSAAALDSHCFPIQFRRLRSPATVATVQLTWKQHFSCGKALHITWLSSLFKLRSGELQILPFLMGMHPVPHNRNAMMACQHGKMSMAVYRESRSQNHGARVGLYCRLLVRRQWRLPVVSSNTERRTAPLATSRKQLRRPADVSLSSAS